MKKLFSLGERLVHPPTRITLKYAVFIAVSYVYKYWEVAHISACFYKVSQENPLKIQME